MSFTNENKEALPTGSESPPSKNVPVYEGGATVDTELGGVHELRKDLKGRHMQMIAMYVFYSQKTTTSKPRFLNHMQHAN